MSQPLVSVIVPNYNYAKYLPERMNSILNQTFQDFEVILLDDCSTDNSREIIESFREHPKVSSINYNEKNSGSPFLQWEKGISMARGKYIWIAEADDSAEPTLLEKTVEALESDDKMTIAMVMSRTIDGDSRDTGQCKYDDCEPDEKTNIYDGNKFITHKMLAGNRCYNASMTVFSRHAWQNITAKNYLSMRYCGDWMFWILIMSQGNAAVVQQNLSYFRFHGNSVTDFARKMNASTPEVWNIMYYTFKNFNVPKHIRYLLTYRILRVYHESRFEETRPKPGVMSPEFDNFVEKEMKRYAWYWIYKHWFHALHQKLTKYTLTPLYTL